MLWISASMPNWTTRQSGADLWTWLYTTRLMLALHFPLCCAMSVYTCVGVHSSYCGSLWGYWRLSCRHAWERFVAARCAFIHSNTWLAWVCLVAGQSSRACSQHLIGKHNHVFKNTFYGCHGGGKEKETERYIFIRTLAVTAYFALAIQ